MAKYQPGVVVNGRRLMEKLPSGKWRITCELCGVEHERCIGAVVKSKCLCTRRTREAAYFSRHRAYTQGLLQQDHRDFPHPSPQDRGQDKKRRLGGLDGHMSELWV